MCFSSLEDTISLKNPIRFIDTFVAALGFFLDGSEPKVVLVLKRPIASFITALLKMSYQLQPKNSVQ